jgi:hypothetical protein
VSHPALNLKRSGDHRVSAHDAGYMELQGAVKTGDCHKVKVQGGVSAEKGCCNLFQPFNSKVDEFECGQCEYFRGARHKEPKDAQ